MDGPAYRGVVAGHEPSGTVVSTGPGVRRYRAGDRVVVYHIAGCGLCDNCARGYQISCADPPARPTAGSETAERPTTC
ncbi:alcohol dehydrogenase catalytic domain-containing protein [Streptomyces sp. M10(2022)]